MHCQQVQLFDSHCIAASQSVYGYADSTWSWCELIAGPCGPDTITARMPEYPGILGEFNIRKYPMHD